MREWLSQKWQIAAQENLKKSDMFEYSYIFPYNWRYTIMWHLTAVNHILSINVKISRFKLSVSAQSSYNNVFFFFLIITWRNLFT